MVALARAVGRLLAIMSPPSSFFILPQQQPRHHHPCHSCRHVISMPRAALPLPTTSNGHHDRNGGSCFRGSPWHRELRALRGNPKATSCFFHCGFVTKGCASGPGEVCPKSPTLRTLMSPASAGCPGTENQMVSFFVSPMCCCTEGDGSCRCCGF